MKKESYLLLYFAVSAEEGKNRAADPRYAFFLNAQKCVETIATITDVLFSTISPYKGEIAIPGTHHKLSFALGETEQDAKARLKKSIPDAFDQPRRDFCAYGCVKLNQDQETVLINYKKEQSSSLFQYATAIKFSDNNSYEILTTSNNNVSSPVMSFDDFKTHIIEQLKDDSLTKKQTSNGFFASLTKTLSMCCGRQDNAEDRYEMLDDAAASRAEKLDSSLYNKIESAQTVNALFDVLRTFYADNQADEPGISKKIDELLTGHFDAVRIPSTEVRTSVTMGNNCNSHF